MIEFSALPGSNYTLNNWYAVALTMEDYPNTTINIGGKVYTPHTPITSVPLQVSLQRNNKEKWVALTRQQQKTSGPTQDIFYIKIITKVPLYID